MGVKEKGKWRRRRGLKAAQTAQCAEVVRAQDPEVSGVFCRTAWPEDDADVAQSRGTQGRSL